MAVISGGRYARGAQKALSIKGETVIPDLDSALQAGFELSELEDHPDTRILFGWRSYGFGIVVAAVANDFLAFSLSNPVGSGILAVVDRFEVVETSVFDSVLLIARDASQQAVTNRGVARDIRSVAGGSTNASICIFGSGTPAAQSGTKVGMVPADSVAAAVARYPVVRGGGDELVLLPGDIFAVFSNSNPAGGVAGAGGIWWRERALDPSELTA